MEREVFYTAVHILSKLCRQRSGGVKSCAIKYRNICCANIVDRGKEISIVDRCKRMIYCANVERE